MEWIELGKLIKIRKGNKLEEVENTSNSIRMIMIEDLRSDMNYKYTKIDKKNVIVNENDIVIAWDGANAGTIGFNLKGAIGSTLARLSIQTDNISAKYLGNFLRSRFKEIRDNCTGATIPHVSRAHLNSINVPVPPIEIQEKIVKVLDQAQTLIDKRNEQIEALDQLIESIFYMMFGDPVRNEKDWEIRKLEEFGSWTSGGTPSRKIKEYFEGDINWFSAGELNSRYIYKSKEKITERAIAESSAKIFEKDSLLIGMYDSAAFKLSILKEDSSSNQACANLVCNENYNFEWVYTLFQFMKPIYLQSRKGVRQKNLSQTIIKKFEAIAPPIQLQNEFAQKVEVIEKQKELLNQSLELLEENYKSIMDKAFKGQLFN